VRDKDVDKVSSYVYCAWSNTDQNSNQALKKDAGDFTLTAGTLIMGMVPPTTKAPPLSKYRTS
jgi:hypothetical protein